MPKMQAYCLFWGKSQSFLCCQFLTKSGMREKFVKKKKNRTRTRIALENMKRPTVIVSAFDDDELYLLNEGTVMISDLVMFHYDCQTKESRSSTWESGQSLEENHWLSNKCSNCARADCKEWTRHVRPCSFHNVGQFESETSCTVRRGPSEGLMQVRR